MIIDWNLDQFCLDFINITLEMTEKNIFFNEINRKTIRLELYFDYLKIKIIVAITITRGMNILVYFLDQKFGMTNFTLFSIVVRAFISRNENNYYNGKYLFI